ncbi:MAG: phytoene/squalene synthase family protein [Bacteroidetes Order II. Incertae sedis bacterium]|nr:phytoene/squalene synthase family protein [Bacteroidetes Order II. bacterium]
MLQMPLSETAIWQDFRRHSRTFSMATHLLPSEIRMPVATLYRYCRIIDNIADEMALRAGKKQALSELAQVEDHLLGVFAGKPPTEPFWRRLSVIHEQFTLSHKPMQELIEGARWDLTDQKVYSEDDLLSYANLVAGCVGAMMLPFLVRSQDDRMVLEPTARALGNAMQVTNIIRDVGEDIRTLDRIYIPESWLSESGFSRQTLCQDLPPAGYAHLMERMMQLAEQLYIEGFKGIHRLPARVRGGIRAAARLYREILNEVRQNEYNNLTRRAYVPTTRKIRLVLDNDYYRRRDALLPHNHPKRIYPPLFSTPS